MTLSSSLLRGAIGFTAVSVASFAIWAYAGRWFHRHGGELAMYSACAAVFILGGALLLHPLIWGERSLLRFSKVFFSAFLAYAVAWSVAWFALGFPYGEWVASAVGSLVFVAVAASFLGGWKHFLSATVVLFVLHSLGYFTGAEVYYPSDHSTGKKLLWGILYGAGFGTGVGYVFHSLQRSQKA
jgi:hypothetical protein